MMQQLFDFERRQQNAEAAVNYLHAGGIPITESALIYLFMMHESAKLIIKTPQVLKLPISLAAAGRWVRENYGPCKNLKFNRSTTSKKFRKWQERGVMDRLAAGPDALFCDFSAAQRYADSLHECLEQFSAGLADRAKRSAEIKAPELSENGERIRAYPGVSASIDGLNEFKESQSINPATVAALKQLPPEIWTPNRSDVSVMRLVRDWSNEHRPPELPPLDVLAGVLATRHGEPKTDPVAYLATCLRCGVRDNWITRAKGLIKSENYSPH